MEEKKLVPKLRFPGFTEPWEQRKLGEIFKERNERSGQGELISVTVSQGVIKAADLDRDINSSIDKHNYKVVKQGDVVYNTMRMWQGACGYSPYRGILSPAYTVLIPGKNTLGTLFDYYFKRIELLQIFKKYSQGMTSDTWNLKFDILKQVKLPFPSVEEQGKIVQLFSSCDANIALHQRKLEHLKLKKKSLLQKLFPKEGEVYPELRFPGFTDPWEQRKGDEIFISVSDKGYPQLPVLSASQELGMVYRDENGIDIHHNKSNEDTYKRVLPGQFVIHLRSFQGGFAYSNVEGITSPAYTVITFKNPELHYGLFWKQVFKSLTFIKHLETITYGIRDGRSISFSDFRSLKLCYPTYGEQKFIGDGLEKTDNLITLHQRKLEHLQLLKKALLQQLFV